jgi:hypothetical protein
LKRRKITTENPKETWSIFLAIFQCYKTFFICCRQ